MLLAGDDQLERQYNAVRGVLSADTSGKILMALRIHLVLPLVLLFFLVSFQPVRAQRHVRWLKETQQAPAEIPGEKLRFPSLLSDAGNQVIESRRDRCGAGPVQQSVVRENIGST